MIRMQQYWWIRFKEVGFLSTYLQPKSLLGIETMQKVARE